MHLRNDVALQISVGENMITGVATGTGLCLAALPVPPPMQFLEACDVHAMGVLSLLDFPR